jgi:hypothetical protein
MRVQDLLLAVLFLEGITAPLAVIQRPLRAFKGIARSTPERPKSRTFRARDSLGCASLVSAFVTMPTRHHACPNRYWTRARDGDMLSLTMEEIRACIPFGAAHRVNFDTPPLKGNCPDTSVSRQIPLKTQHAYKNAVSGQIPRKHGDGSHYG